MKRKLKKLIPHITIVLALMTLTFFVIDRFNEFMAFMTSDLSKWVFAALAAFSLATSVRLVIADFKQESAEQAEQEVSEHEAQ